MWCFLMRSQMHPLCRGPVCVFETSGRRGMSRSVGGVVSCATRSGGHAYVGICAETGTFVVTCCHGNGERAGNKGPWVGGRAGPSRVGPVWGAMGRLGEQSLGMKNWPDGSVDPVLGGRPGLVQCSQTKNIDL